MGTEYRDREWLEEKCIKEKLSVIQIAELCGVNRSSVYTYLGKFGLKDIEGFKKVKCDNYRLSKIKI